MDKRTYAMRYFGIEIEPRLTDDEWILLRKIHECHRRANIVVGGRVHEPEFGVSRNGTPVMADIPVDEDFSKLCSEQLM